MCLNFGEPLLLIKIEHIIQVISFVKFPFILFFPFKIYFYLITFINKTYHIKKKYYKEIHKIL